MLQLDQIFRNDQDGDTFDHEWSGAQAAWSATRTTPRTANVVDADPRIISNLISDQTANNPRRRCCHRVAAQKTSG